jgi:hypothetical protein
VANKYNKDSLLQNFTRFGYAIIVLDVAGHIAHNLFHLLAEGKSILYTGLTLIGQAVGHDASLAVLGMETIQLLQFGLIALGFLGSLYAAYRISRSNYQRGFWGTFASYAVLMLIFTAINVWLFVLPMAMRM